MALADARARLLQHVAAERHDQARALRERDELERRDAAAARMVPAREGLDGHGRAGGEIDDRLVLDDDLALLDRALELGPEAVAPDDRVAHRRREDREAALAALLRVVHGDVGVAQEVVGARLRLARGDPDAEADVDELLAGDDRQGEGPQRALGELDRAPLGRRRAADEDGELVAADPRDDILAAHGAQQPGGDAAQQLVADGAPQRVVDALEVVEIDEHHGDLARRARLERLAHLLAEQGAVGEPGERVVLGLVLELLLEVAQLGHGVLVAVDLQRGARVGGQRLEQGAVAVREAAREPEAVREHDRADHALLAAQHAEHAVPDAALLEVEVGASRGTDASSSTDSSEPVAHVRSAMAAAVSTGTSASRAVPGPRLMRSGAPAVGGEEDDLGLLGVEGLERSLEQALERDGDLVRLGQVAVGLGEEVRLLVVLALPDVGARPDDRAHDRDQQQRRRLRPLDPEDAADERDQRAGHRDHQVHAEHLAHLIARDAALGQHDRGEDLHDRQQAADLGRQRERRPT